MDEPVGYFLTWATLYVTGVRTGALADASGYDCSARIIITKAGQASGIRARLPA